MALSASTIELQLQTRLRIGSAGNAITDANLFSIMNYVQRTINYSLKRELSSATLTGASATVLTECTTTIGTDFNAIISVHESTRSLMRVANWNQLKQYDSSWIGSTAARSEAWSPVGRNMIAVYPASTGTYTVTYIQETTTINSSGDTLNLPDEDGTLLIDLCELVWLAHLRLYPETVAKVEQLNADLTAHRGKLI